jgi:hypothetical protein
MVGYSIAVKSGMGQGVRGRCGKPSSPAKAGDPVFQSIFVHHQRSGILGRPVKPGDDGWICVLVLATCFVRVLQIVGPQK